MSLIRIPALTRRVVQPAAASRPNPEILAVTPDDRLYSSLLYTATQKGWSTRWAKSADRAVEMLTSGTNSIVLYDWYSVAQPWQIATDRFLGADPSCCVVLAVNRVSEDLWEQALRSRLYDIVPRAGHAGVLAATLQFAWYRQVRLMTGFGPPCEFRAGSVFRTMLQRLQV